jgi:hypothetical protein
MAHYIPWDGTGHLNSHHLYCCSLVGVYHFLLVGVYHSLPVGVYYFLLVGMYHFLLVGVLIDVWKGGCQ